MAKKTFMGICERIDEAVLSIDGSIQRLIPLTQVTSTRSIRGGLMGRERREKMWIVPYRWEHQDRASDALMATTKGFSHHIPT